MPILDLCIKESIRLHVAGCALRMNTSGKSTVIDSTGEAIGDGVLVVRDLIFFFSLASSFSLSFSFYSFIVLKY